ncbi:type I toxin-antitoxin system Hok family toxin [Salmonella enterica]|nr:type I toxin-antitoxin system Hok family toxin [Salmonella enterica]EAA8092823.1 type I toxin-antitoxin system Hok family toxin [Salmonella enterica subsp. enterica serovar Molade]EBH8703923.1 type I toxin-antitoxin system Hok family toxin [Salmonella enterica subsp. enterica serovar Liverpool]EBW2311213.1 type I toxin-antitoxin system Hok family toxin [Salmonella enterica subsp. enterica serovar Kingston]EBW2320697.1 type I toxin-antitoxin system Hok family toxin [Salmonella enterica subsp.
MLITLRLASYPPKGKEKKAMKLKPNSFIWCVFIVCLTLLIFTWLTRKSLCEIRYRDGSREVAAFMAYESGK